MRFYTNIIWSHSLPSVPVAFFNGRNFERLDQVIRENIVPGKGIQYSCVHQGRPLSIWQMWDSDGWFIEMEEAPPPAQHPIDRRAY